MSDRIDELLTRPLGYQNARAYAVKHELATIAREAEARALKAEADSIEWVDRCYQSDERADKAEAMCEWLAEELLDNGWCKLGPETPCTDDGCIKCALKAASEAVKS